MAKACAPGSKKGGKGKGSMPMPMESPKKPKGGKK